MYGVQIGDIWCVGNINSRKTMHATSLPITLVDLTKSISNVNTPSLDNQGNFLNYFIIFIFYSV